MVQYDPQLSVFDNHCHVCFPRPIGETLENYRQLFASLSIRRAGLLSCPASSHNKVGIDVLENMKMLYLKEKLDIPCFAYAGFTWHTMDRQANADFAAQMLQMGFDGFKTLEQHPRVRRMIGKSLADPSLEGFFEVANANKSVMVCHVGDPSSSWDLSTASESAIKMGRVYANGFLSLEELRKEMETVIARCPDMRFILAHFYFMSPEHDRVCRFLDAHPNVYFDLTPGGEMFVNFTKDPALWYDFFQKYSHRIILGSDHYGTESGSVRYELVRNYLEGSEPFTYGKDTIVPNPMPREVLDNIYWKNIHGLLGDTPKPVDGAMAYDHCRWIGEHFDLDPEARENLEIMTQFWKQK